MDSLDKHLPEIVEIIEKGRAVLFLGAGASAAAGAPLEKELVEALKQKFPKLDVGFNTLLEVCQDYVETPGYNRKDLEDFITQKLGSLNPTPAHLSLTKYNWPAVFTTNFDDLVETAYRNSQNCLKHCYTVSYPNESPIVDRSKVYLFKLMGTISTRPENKMVLCRADYNKMISKRSDYLEDLEDFVQDGTIIFIGYKAFDRLALDIIDTVIDRIGLQRTPWSYVLLKNRKLSEKERYRFQSHKIIPIQCSFEDFFKKLDEIVSKEGPLLKAPLPKGIKVRIEGKDIILSRREIDSFEDYFKILNEDLISSEVRNRDDFYRGMIDNYGCYREGLDFIREVYSTSTIRNGEIVRPSLKDRILAEINERGQKEIKVVLVTGPPGVGKSILLRRLAYDVYSSGTAPVIVFDKTRLFFDRKLLSSALVTLDRRFDKACEPEEAHRLKSLIIIDDVTIDPFLTKDYLSSRGRLATIVIAARDNELLDLRTGVPEADTYRIDEYLSPNEKTGIVKHLFKLGYIPTTDAEWDYMLDKEFENSFFATMYMLVHHSQKPLNAIIRDQFIQLTEEAKRAFSYICAFHQFNLPINLELLVRALRCSYEQFYSDTMPNAKGIIFEEYVRGYLLYTAHHRIIARKTIEFFFGHTNAQKNLFLEVLSDVNLRNSKERELIQKILIRHLSSDSRSTDLTRSDKIEIYEEVNSQFRTKALLHHLGVLLSAEGEYSKAEEVLKESLAERDKTAPYLSELNQNILTSLGTLYSRMTLRDFEQNPEQVGQNKRLAESYFLKARFGGFPNAHSYHAHANMYLKIGDLLSDELQKADAYATAFHILQEARDNLNEEQLQLIYELEMMIFKRLGETKKILQNAAKIAEKYKNAKGYTLYANMLVKECEKFKLKTERQRFLKRALSVIEEALETFPTDEYCLRLKSRLIRLLYPLNTKLLFDCLSAWYNNSQTPNIWLLFELAVTAFKLGQYEFSRRLFTKLENERISGGIKRRFQELLFTGRYGNPVKFVGIISSIENRYEGYIRCDSLSNLHYPLHFRPIACGFQPVEGEMVEFNIAFDFLGPRAVRVTRVA